MERGRVTARGGLRLRASPGNGTIRKTLRRGTKLEILERQTWLRVRTADKTGWVRADFVEPDLGMHVSIPGKIDIQPYENTKFVGDPIRVDADFVPALDRINGFASQCGVEIWVTSSFRRPKQRIRATVVPAAKRSNHLVGHAIDMNVRCREGFFNSRTLKKAEHSHLPQRVREFLELVQGDPSLRWGGDFRPEDPVHIDDGLNRRDPDQWQQKFATLKEL